MRILVDGVARDATAAEEAELIATQTAASELPSLHPQKTKVFKADIWRRATDAEAEQIDAMLNSQPLRLRRMWNDTTFLSTTDELFPLIRDAALALFGEDRAGELLDPSE